MIALVRTYGLVGFNVWRYGGKGDSSTNENITDNLEAIEMPQVFEAYSISSTKLSSTSFSVEWHTNSSTASILEYKSSDLFTYTWSLQSGFNYWWVQHAASTLVINMTHSTYHKFTLTGLIAGATYYFRCISIGSGNYTSLEDNLTLSITVTVSSPSNVTYTSSLISVSLSASGGTIDKIWWNCTFANGTVVYANTTYTVATTMTLEVGNYIFHAMTNNTDGDTDEETVMFTVEYEVFASITTQWGGYWGSWWGYP
jgi:hypothetical protein